MHSTPSTLSVSVFVFITYSWHLTRTGSAAPGFGKKEQVADEQVSLTHLHGSTRKNKRERVEIAQGGERKKKKRKREREEWRVPLDAVCNAAGSLPARSATEFQTCQSSWLSSLAEGKRREKFHKHFWYPRDGDCQALLKNLRTCLSHQGLKRCPQRGTREMLTR